MKERKLSCCGCGAKEILVDGEYCYGCYNNLYGRH